MRKALNIMRWRSRGQRQKLAKKVSGGYLQRLSTPFNAFHGPYIYHHHPILSKSTIIFVLSTRQVLGTVNIPHTYLSYVGWYHIFNYSPFEVSRSSWRLRNTSVKFVTKFRQAKGLSVITVSRKAITNFNVDFVRRRLSFSKQKMTMRE
jgi:hypothetical protein